MKKFEYLEIEGRAGNDTFHAGPVSITQLNGMGSKGWRLIERSGTVALFEREIQPYPVDTHSK